MRPYELYDILSRVQNCNPVLNQLVREGKLTDEDLTIWQDNVVALAEKEGLLQETPLTDEEEWYARNAFLDLNAFLHRSHPDNLIGKTVTIQLPDEE